MCVSLFLVAKVYTHAIPSLVLRVPNLAGNSQDFSIVSNNTLVTMSSKKFCLKYIIRYKLIDMNVFNGEYLLIIRKIPYLAIKKAYYFVRQS